MACGMGGSVAIQRAGSGPSALAIAALRWRPTPKAPFAWPARELLDEPASRPHLPHRPFGPCCHGATEQSVLKQLKRIVEDWIRLRDVEGIVVPSPQGATSYSGRFLLRVPPPVHQALALKARAAGKSLNSYCAERLARFGS